MSKPDSPTKPPEKQVSHTPGPWKADTNANYVWAGSQNEMMVCEIRGWGYLTGKGGGSALPDATAILIQEANAHLIAAAPDLLAALKAVIANHCGNDKLFCSSCSSARQVIAKAEGR